jgi:hypothetical protein
MSSIANNFAFLARSKLRSACSSGSRDNLSLHRWVLLKNSITVHPEHPQFEPSQSDGSSSEGVNTQCGYPDGDVEVEFEEEEVGIDSIDEDVFSFRFPDPGDSVAATDEASASEEQWLDSLLETLVDDDDSSDIELDLHGSPPTPTPSPSSSCPPSPVLSSPEQSSSSLPISVPNAVPYPTCRPPFTGRPFDIDSRDFFAYHFSPVSCPPSPSSSYLHHYDILDDSDTLSVPDAIEDASSSDDETDSLSTPFSRSRSSLNLVDPALVPLPHDGPEPQIYSASRDGFRPIPYDGSDQLPYYDYNSASTPVYSPYHQSC